MVRTLGIAVVFTCAVMFARRYALANEERPILSASWRLLENRPDGQLSAELTIVNSGAAPLDGDWALYFNCVSKLLPESVSPHFQLAHINGDFYSLRPSDRLAPIPPGGNCRVSWRGIGAVLNTSYAPSGLYWVAGGPARPTAKPGVIPLRLEPFPGPEKLKRGPGDQVEVVTTTTRFLRNEHLQKLAAAEIAPVTPTPLSTNSLPGKFRLGTDTRIVFEPAVAREAAYLVQSLTDLLTAKLSAAPLTADHRPEPNEIRLRLATSDLPPPSATTGDEAYELTVEPQTGIEIVGTGPAGVFYGIQTLRGLAPVASFRDRKEHVELAAVQIHDAPRFGYRGLHLDVARNFHPPATVKKLIDLMAFYKLNRLHLHLTDDEGWRIEIRQLPELTQIGSRRGHTVDESDRLLPSRGSGPFPDPNVSPGSGYFSTADYIDLLRYAHARHIAVIPEIDLPGHSRAAIKSMEARQRRLRSTDLRGAEEYRLVDPGDTSLYESVQMWRGNVVDVGRDSTYHFIDTVVGELAEMYHEAAVPLVGIHLGGDEVPNGVWEKSPACAQVATDPNSKIARRGQLELAFLDRASRLIISRSIQPACWEDCLLLEARQDKHAVATRRATGRPTPTAYVWNSVWGWGQEDTAYRLANAGFDVVLCNAPNLYIDLACEWDPLEIGYGWAGFVSTRAPFEFKPFDIFQRPGQTTLGQPVTRESLAAGERLTEEGARHIVGLQGQLWSENLTSREVLEYMAFPRAIALAERAWAAAPAKASGDDFNTSAAREAAAWNEFANRLGQRELPRLDYLYGGVQYRLPPPGAVVNSVRHGICAIQ